LEVLVNEVEIRCRPSNLPSQIELDISNLALGENFQIKDLPKLDGVEYVGDLDGMLVSCVGSAGGRSSAEDEEVAIDGELSEAGSSDSSSEEDSKE
jgi:large subunit ribosomal protein L25